MRLSPYQLADSLKQALKPVYLIFGAEPLVIEETLSAVRKACIEAGFAEREKYTVETGFDWNQLLVSQHAMSLFSNKKRIEVRIPTGKPGDQGSKALIAYAESAPADNVLLVIAGDVEKRAQSTKWFKALDAAGAVIEAAEIKGAHMEKWVAHRLAQHGVSFEPEVPAMIAHYVEGNLLAASQQIHQLALLTSNDTVSSQLVKELVSDQARFTSFGFVDACLAGNAARAVRILTSLRREQFEPVLLLWALARETRRLAIMASARLNHQHPDLQKLGIWSSRVSLMNQALNRLPPKRWLRLHADVADLDRKIKGQLGTTHADFWEDVAALSLRMCGQT